MMSEIHEEVTLHHFIHEHPLYLFESNKGDQCHGCFRRFTKAAAYACKKCGDKKILHQQCAEMPRKIWHPTHPQHALIQQRGDGSRDCALCEERIFRIGYFCSSSICEFRIHLACAPAKGMKHVDDQQISIMHPSHTEHELVLVNKGHSFECDACGTVEKGRSYMCLACQYWIHERCAALPATACYDQHHHPLALAFYLPIQYIKFGYACDVCNKDFLLNSWVYHCELCRFVVHIKCAIIPLLPYIASSEDADEVDSQSLIRFPICEPHEEVIKPFVIRVKGEMSMPRDDEKHWFSNHHHQLGLCSSLVSEIKDDDEEEEDLNNRQTKAELICDGCIMPISLNKKRSPSSTSSSSSDYKRYNYYMSCGECNYFLHLECFHVPPELSSHPLHEADHKLILETIYTPKLKCCSLCKLFSNGLFYCCTKCVFKADIKCASLPNTIQHEAHPHHHLQSKFISVDYHFDINKSVRQDNCGGCRSIIGRGIIYNCDNCDFMLCRKCIFLPATNKHESDKHPLPLRYDANLNHPDDFYCDECECVINPKKWMYHCRDCDTSFHPQCFLATSGYCRNIKFGQQFSVSVDLHPHPLAFQLLTTKLRCNVCRLRIHGEKGVEQVGFHCSSCNFFLCFYCGKSTYLWSID